MIEIKVADIRLWQANYRQGDVAMIIKSIAQFGYNRSVSLWRDNVVIAGNHTVKALQQMENEGYDPPQNVTVIANQWIIEVTDASHLSDKEAEAYAIADNRASDIATNDESQLASLLQQLQNEDEQLFQATGWNSDDLQELLRGLVIEPPNDFQEYGDDIDIDYCCPKCGYEWSGKPK